MSSQFDLVWLKVLDQLLYHGQSFSPRGKKTFEIPQNSVTISMDKPVLMVTARGLSYQFMAAEAFWILSGDNTVEGIAEFNKHIAKFSDDSKIFFGAYGPKITSQLDYVISKLKQDPYTRQAGLTIWRENPPETKDYPCTISIFFMLRNGFLNCHVFMRSSDVWLGLPYDVFNFSVLTHYICCQLNKNEELLIKPGILYLTAASMHLYEENFELAKQVLADPKRKLQMPVPAKFVTDELSLMTTLEYLRTSKPGDPARWWEFK